TQQSLAGIAAVRILPGGIAFQLPRCAFPSPDQFDPVDAGTGDVDGLSLRTAEIDHLVDVVAEHAQFVVAGATRRHAQRQLVTFRTLRGELRITGIPAAPA